jgi:GNAT acetyltransferase-like protein
MIGPLFCTDRAAAERLLGALLDGVDDGPVFLDVPVPNEPGIALARDLGLEPVFETARMYRGPAPDLRLDRVFGVTTFELG